MISAHAVGCPILKTKKHSYGTPQQWGVSLFGYKTSWIVTLIAFPQIALSQLRHGKGLKSPGFSVIQFLEGVVSEMNSPTDEQAALIKLTLEGRGMNYPDRYSQENLLNLHKAKMHLEMAIGLLSQ